MFAGLIALLGSSAFGSIIGGAFAWLNKKNDLQIKAMEIEQENKRLAHELASKRLDMELIQAEAKGKAEVAVIEGNTSIETARMAAIAEAQKADALSSGVVKEAGWWKWVLIIPEGLRRLVRPVLTILLTTGALMITNSIMMKLENGWSDFTPTQRYELVIQAISWVMAQASAAISYWFVSRGSSER
jgi:predicted DNA binding protein